MRGGSAGCIHPVQEDIPTAVPVTTKLLILPPLLDSQPRLPPC